MDRCTCGKTRRARRRSPPPVAANIEQAHRSAGNDTEKTFKAIEEYAIEASLAKVHGSEVLAMVVDEGVQIFGGYGFMQEYPIEKAYRDARIQRIFEGTNEINRLVASGTLFSRVLTGKLPLTAQYPTIEARVRAGQPLNGAGESIPAELRDAVNALERAKDVTIYSALKIAMKYMRALENEEEFIEYLANLLIDLYASDSALARATQAVRRRDEKQHPCETGTTGNVAGPFANALKPGSDDHDQQR